MSKAKTEKFKTLDGDNGGIDWRTRAPFQPQIRCPKVSDFWYNLNVGRGWRRKASPTVGS